MKKFFKQAICLTVLIFMVSIFANARVYAATDGYDMKTAISISTDKEYTKTWNEKNWNKDCYNKFTVSTSGYVTILGTKLVLSDGTKGTLSYELYDSKGNAIWEANTYGTNDKLSSTTYHVGLKAGTYYLNISSDYYVTKSASIKYRVKFSKASNYETESNNTKSLANKLSFGKTLKGYVNDGDADWYKLYSDKAANISISLGNYSKLKGKVYYITAIDKDGKENKIYYSNFIANKDGSASAAFKIKAGTTYFNLSCGYGDEASYSIRLDKMPALTTSFTIGSYKYKINKLSIDNEGYKSIAQLKVVGRAKTSITSVVIPNTVNYRGLKWEVVSISANAFKNSNIKSVQLPENIKSLGTDAFNGCKYLAKITNDNYLITIGDGAFKGCTSLTSITLKGRLEKVGANAFYNCTNLKTITSTSYALKSVGKNALKNINKNAVIRLEYYYLDKELFANKGQASTVRIVEK